MSQLKSNFISSALATFINAVVGLISIPFLTRHMSPSDFGHVSLLLLFFNLFVFLDGMQPVVIRFAHVPTYGRADLLQTCRIVSRIIGIAALTVTFTLLVVLFGDLFSWMEIGLLALCALLYFPMTNEGAFIEAKQRVGFVMIVRSATWTLVYASFIIYVIFQLPFECYSLSLAGMNALLLIVYKAGNTGEPGDGRFNRSMIKGIAVEVKRVITYNLCLAVMTFSDRLLISRYLPLDQLGYYAAQYELGTRGYILPYAVTRVLFPNYSKRMATENPLELVEEWAHVAKLVFFAMFIITLLAFAFSEKIIRLYAGDAYAPYHYVFRVVLIGIAINSLGFLAALFQRANGDFSSQEKAYLIGAAIGVVSAYPLVKGFGVPGAAVFYLMMRSADILLILKMQEYFHGKGRKWPLTAIRTLLFVSCYLLLYWKCYYGFIIAVVLFSVLLFNSKDRSFILNILKINKIFKSTPPPRL